VYLVTVTNSAAFVFCEYCLKSLSWHKHFNNITQYIKRVGGNQWLMTARILTNLPAESTVTHTQTN
jgi:hypothetical protein